MKEPTQLTTPAPDWFATAPDAWQALAAQHGTPFYLFDADLLAARMRCVREAFGGTVQVYHAVKCNPNLGLLRSMLGVADGLDISSGGELEQALLAGHAAERMSFAGPSKTDQELEAAISAGVGAISVESLREIDACARIAAVLGRQAQVLLRVNPQQVHRGYGLKMGGRAVQFGIDEEALPEAETRIRAHGDHIAFRGIHAYVGSQCFDAVGVAESTANALRIADEVRARSGLVSEKINLGGGFGIAHSTERRELDLAQLQALLEPVLTAWRAGSPAAARCALIFELGRFLCAPAGLYVTQVVGTKTSRGKDFVTCDGGLNHHLAAAGTFGAALRGNFPLLNLSRPDAPPQTCNLSGASCNPTDLLGVDATLPAPQAGDLIGIAMSGAYGLTASPMLFLGRRTPVELVRSGQDVRVGRRSYGITDFN